MISLTKLLKDIANTLRIKTDKEEPINPQDFETELLNISQPTLAKSMSDNIGSGKHTIEKITISGTINKIEKDAFISSTFTELIIEEGVEIIDAKAFYQNTVLNKVSLPNTLKALNINSFGDCKAITELVIPASVESIKGAFMGCISLSNITVEQGNAKYSSRGMNIIFNEDTKALVQACKNSIIPTETKIIDSYAFYNIPVSSITIPDSVTTIGESALYGNYITEITLGNSVTSLANKGISNTFITELYIPDSVISLGLYCIYSNTKLEQVRISKNIPIITVMCFSGCNNLKNVIFPEGSVVSSFNSEAFSSCSSLEELVIPGNKNAEGNTIFRSIGTGVFKECTNFKILDLSQLDDIPTLGANVFEGCHPDLQIKVQKGKMEEMAIMTNWSDIKERIVEVEVEA